MAFLLHHYDSIKKDPASRFEGRGRFLAENATGPDIPFKLFIILPISSPYILILHIYIYILVFGFRHMIPLIGRGREN